MAFGYARYAVVFVSAFVTLPLVLARIDTAVYGRWLVAVELLAYLGFAELGVLGVLPWLVAELDGRNDRAGLRQLMAEVRMCLGAATALYLVGFGAMWLALPDRLGFGNDGWSSNELGVAVTIIAVLTPISLFGRACSAILTGLQDVRFTGAVTLVLDVVAVGLTLALIQSGTGLVGLAVGMMTPWVVGGVAAAARLYWRDRGLLVGLPRPTAGGVGRLFRDGFGSWLGGVGGRLTLGSNGLLMTLGGATPDDVVRFSCTAKLGDMLTQQAWQVSDCGLVGLAQVNGEGDPVRVRRLTRLMLRLAAVVGGGVAVIVVGANQAFIGAWLGSDRFAGRDVNAALAALAVVLTLTHTQATTTAVLGRRLVVGATGVVYGGVYAVAAVAAVAAIGPVGVPAAGLVVGAAGAVVLGRLLAAQRGPATDAVRDLGETWLPRATGPLVLAAAVGGGPAGATPLIAGPATAALTVWYLWMMRPLMADVPLPGWARRWAERVRLVPLAQVARG